MLSEFGQAHKHTVEKTVFVILAGRSNLTGVHVGAYDGQGFAGGQGVVRLTPTASVREIVFADPKNNPVPIAPPIAMSWICL